MARKLVSHESAPRAGATIDKNPNLRDKHSLPISGTGVMRRREPTNTFVTSKHPNMVFDHSNQLPVIPDTDPRVSVEASQKTGSAPYRTMNRSGHPFAMVGNFVGGSPDDAGNPFGKNKALKDMK